MRDCPDECESSKEADKGEEDQADESNTPLVGGVVACSPSSANARKVETNDVLDLSRLRGVRCSESSTNGGSGATGDNGGVVV